VESRSREELLEKAYQLGFHYEKTYHGCAQCILAVVQDLFGIEEAVFKAASALSAGMCVTGEGPCGALSGGLLALGYYHGRDREHFAELVLSREAASLGRAFRQRFIDEYGSYICWDIQKKVFGRSFNLLDKEDRAAFEAAGGHDQKCPEVVGKAARWLTEILLEEREKEKL